MDNFDEMVKEAIEVVRASKGFVSMKENVGENIQGAFILARAIALEPSTRTGKLMQVLIGGYDLGFCGESELKALLYSLFLYDTQGIDVSEIVERIANPN